MSLSASAHIKLLSVLKDTYLNEVLDVPVLTLYQAIPKDISITAKIPVLTKYILFYSNKILRCLYLILLRNLLKCGFYLPDQYQVDTLAWTDVGN